MLRESFRAFRVGEPIDRRAFSWGDLAVLVLLVTLFYGGIRLALAAPQKVAGPVISLSPRMLPIYATFSLGRMVAAYILSMLFALIFGYWAANDRRAERIIMPILDILQSVPILSFLPAVLLSLAVIFPVNVAAELASIVLIFTSMVWNLTFVWYQSLTTIPKELREASAIFRLNGWFRFKTMELPFGAIGLLWNSMMSWAGGWFFLMAAEIFTVGERDFRLPGLGAFLQEASNQGDLTAIAWGVGALVIIIVALDQLVWRPLLVWSERFKLEMVESDYPLRSWFYDLLTGTRFFQRVAQRVWQPIARGIDEFTLRHFASADHVAESAGGRGRLWWIGGVVGGLLIGYGTYRAGAVLLAMPLDQWGEVGLGALATLLRVTVTLIIAMAWTIPVGVAIGTNARLASWLQPVVQLVASIPATALFPVFLLFLLALPGGLNLAAVLLMLTGTQWYLLFNVIAGASTIPQDLKFTAALLGLSRWERWRTLILPALFPYLVTGAITASGGAWNASIVAEYVHFGGRTVQTVGLGAVIAGATAAGDYSLLLAGTLSMIVVVVVINRLLWRRLYRLSEEQYRME
ncbi:MAG: ABC transporter permease [Anaerolineae bacterium]|jgi:NitT/TauT family transport system permease protein